MENLKDVQGTMTISISDFNKISDKIHVKNKTIEELEAKLKEINIMKSTNCKELESFRYKINEIHELLSNSEDSRKFFSNIKSNNDIIIGKIKIIVNE